MCLDKEFIYSVANWHAGAFKEFEEELTYSTLNGTDTVFDSPASVVSYRHATASSLSDNLTEITAFYLLNNVTVYCLVGVARWRLFTTQFSQIHSLWFTITFGVMVVIKSKTISYTTVANINTIL